MSNPVQRIDHVVAVVEHFEVARRVWTEAGWPVVYDGTMPTHRACCVSIGPINLELLSAEAFDGWPALASWCAQAGRRFGLQAVALDPGDLEATVTALRHRGLAVSAPHEGHLVAPPHALPAARGGTATSMVQPVCSLAYRVFSASSYRPARIWGAVCPTARSNWSSCAWGAPIQRRPSRSGSAEWGLRIGVRGMAMWCG